jgi:alpha-1,3-rhamnosyltransferase
MPAYNYGHFIEEAVRSVFTQTHRPLELVVVDDGSTDNTWEVLERLQKDAPLPMKVLKGEHRGVAAALNLALRNADGEWISILHADDYARPDRVEKQLAAAGPTDVLVHCEYVCVDEHGKLSGYDSSVDLPPLKGDVLRALVELKGDVRSMTVMFRKSAFLQMGEYDESLPVEDWQSILRLSKLGTVAHVPEQLIYRRVHATNISFTAHKKKKTFHFKEIGIDVLKEVCPPDLELDRVLATHTAVVLRNALALGAFEKVADGLRQGFAEFPKQRAYLLAETLRGVTSYVWMHGVKDRLPKPAVLSLLKLKALAMKLRAPAD